MDLNAYISSGIIELYVMGALPAEEAREVERMAAAHPEVRAEIDAQSEALEMMAMAEARPAPEGGRKRLLDAIADDDAPEAEAEPVVRPLRNRTWMAWAAGFLLLALIGSGVLNMSLYNRLQTAEEQVDNLLTEKQMLADKQNEMLTRYSELQADMDILQRPGMKQVHLEGIPDKSPDSRVTVLWDEKSGDLWLAAADLPTPPADKDYQLWAIRDGKPVDMGVFDLPGEGARFHLMANTPAAEAFAVTLEDRGGKPSPTLEEMYAMASI